MGVTEAAQGSFWHIYLCSPGEIPTAEQSQLSLPSPRSLFPAPSNSNSRSRRDRFLVSAPAPTRRGRSGIRAPSTGRDAE